MVTCTTRNTAVKFKLQFTLIKRAADKSYVDHFPSYFHRIIIIDLLTPGWVSEYIDTVK